jgi:hypothetical protein
MIKITLMVALITAITAFAESANARSDDSYSYSSHDAACTADILVMNGGGRTATRNIDNPTHHSGAPECSLSVREPADGLAATDGCL